MSAATKRLLIYCLILAVPVVAKAPELEKRRIYRNRVEILVPKGFKDMPADMVSRKYPSANRPNVIFTDADGTVNVAFNHTTNRATQAQIETLKESLMASFKRAYPSAKWKGSGVTVINGRKVGYCELITPAADQNVYNLLFFSDLDGRLLLCTFNCVEKKLSEWQEPAQQIMRSLTLK